jgi:hypothetical protein
MVIASGSAGATLLSDDAGRDRQRRVRVRPPGRIEIVEARSLVGDHVAIARDDTRR